MANNVAKDVVSTKGALKIRGEIRFNKTGAACGACKNSLRVNAITIIKNVRVINYKKVIFCGICLDVCLDKV